MAIIDDNDPNPTGQHFRSEAEADAGNSFANGHGQHRLNPLDRTSDNGMRSTMPDYTVGGATTGRGERGGDLQKGVAPDFGKAQKS